MRHKAAVSDPHGYFSSMVITRPAGHLVECLHGAAGPGDGQLVDHGGAAQSEVYAPVIL